MGRKDGEFEKHSDIEGVDERVGMGGSEEIKMKGTNDFRHHWIWIRPEVT